MIVLIIGVEGSGHHFALDLFKYAKSDLKIVQHEDSQLQNNLNDDIMSLFLNVFEDQKFKNYFNYKQKLNFEEFYIEFENIISTYKNLSDELQILDLSIPFMKGNSRHLRVLDYFKLSKLLSLDDTKIIYLERDVIRISKSVYNRKIESTILEACFSTQNSLLALNQSKKYFAKFDQLVLNYDNFYNNLDHEIFELEKFFKFKIEFDKAQFQPKEVKKQNDREFKSFWNVRSSYF